MLEISIIAVVVVLVVLKHATAIMNLSRASWQLWQFYRRTFYYRSHHLLHAVSTDKDPPGFNRCMLSWWCQLQGTEVV